MRLIFLGCGYLGFNLSEQLKHDFETELWGIDSPYAPKSDCFRLVDVFDADAMRNMDCRDAVVVDTVSLVGNNASSDDEDGVLSSLKQKYEGLLKGLQEGGAKQFVFFSSGGTVYGNISHPASESDPVHPMSLYARSKVMIEDLLKESGMDYLILRLSNPFGGYQLAGKKQGVIPILIRAALLNEVFTMWIDGHSVRDYFYIDDLAQALRLLLEKDVHREILNVGSGIPTELNEVIAAVEETTGCPVRIRREENNVPMVSAIVLNTEKLQKLTGYSPAVSLAEGIRLETLRIRKEEGL